ncbi:hypothetical protein BBJ28_00024701, partial [Nothophytophthora sp. Chile5]
KRKRHVSYEDALAEIIRVEATPAEPEPDDHRRKRQARRSTKKYRLNKRFEGMRVDGNEPQRVNADGVDSSAVAVAEPVVPVEVGEGAAPNQVSSRQDGSGALANHEDFDIEKVTGENVFNGRHKLPDPTIICEHCSAWRWPGESPMKCCSKGRVQLPPLKAAPAVLAECYNDPEFRKHIRAYNQVFAFTSVGASRTDTGSVQRVRADESVQGQRGVYTYRVQGAMGHYMGSLLPYNDRATGEMTAPKFAQIYIVDADMQRRAERRRGVFADLDPSILFDLEQMMERHNPFAQDFLYFGKVLRRQREAGHHPVDIVFKLHANNRASPGTYNLPTISEVAAVMIDDGNIGLHSDLLLYTRDHTPTRLFETHAIYDPLQYPLLFPCGEPGCITGLVRSPDTSLHCRELRRRLGL